jgi:dephospho-CoA kinase
LDRAALGAIVFGDPVARRDLERIIHPAVRARAAEIESGAGPDAVVVHVIPLLVETGQADDFDLVVVVDVDHDTQLERLRTRNSLTAEQAEARLAAQATREQRLAVADEVLDNSGTVAELERQVDTLWGRLPATAR